MWGTIGPPRAGFYPPINIYTLNLLESGPPLPPHPPWGWGGSVLGAFSKTFKSIIKRVHNFWASFKVVIRSQKNPSWDPP